MERLLPKLGFALALVATSIGPVARDALANILQLPDIEAGQIELAGCVKICGRYGTCWRNGHRVRCCTRWICRY